MLLIYSRESSSFGTSSIQETTHTGKIGLEELLLEFSRGRGFTVSITQFLARKVAFNRAVQFLDTSGAFAASD